MLFQFLFELAADELLHLHLLQIGLDSFAIVKYMMHCWLRSRVAKLFAESVSQTFVMFAAEADSCLQNSLEAAVTS